MPTRPPDERRGDGARGGAHRAPALDRHLLYAPAVQHVADELAVVERVYRRLRGRTPLRLREDFCGTAALACAWVERGRRRRAWGVDLHGATLAWARRRRLPNLGPAAERVVLLHSDARAATRPQVDVVVALNYSYWVFRRRAELREYFRAARRSLRVGGLLFLDAFGGTGAMQALVETRRVAASRGPGGEHVPPFTFAWEQVSFNPVDHRLRCRIHFRLRDDREMPRAFAYDWRLWTLPELRELLVEAGFRGSRVYLQDWDHATHMPLPTYSPRQEFTNQLTWLVYVVGLV